MVKPTVDYGSKNIIRARLLAFSVKVCSVHWSYEVLLAKILAQRSLIAAYRYI